MTIMPHPRSMAKMPKNHYMLDGTQNIANSI
jgi:hypothetical protein